MQEPRNRRPHAVDTPRMPKKCPAPPSTMSPEGLLVRIVAPCASREDVLELGIRLGADQLLAAIDASSSALPSHVESCLYALHARLLVLADLRRQELSDLNK